MSGEVEPSSTNGDCGFANILERTEDLEATSIKKGVELNGKW